MLFIRVVIQNNRDLLEENEYLTKTAVKTVKEAIAAEKAKHKKSA